MTSTRKSATTPLPELLLIDKPKGITSFDCIRRLRKTYGAKIKFGHAGTLDPLATGLMLIGVGEGTRKLTELIGLPKTYETEVLLGTRTETGDLDGTVVEQRSVACPAQDAVEAVLAGMVGALDLPVPLFSAVKRDGTRLYAYAHKGEYVEPPVRTMHITSLKILSIEPYESGCILSLRMDVGSGTYVRSVAEEIGRRLGVPATVKELRRTRIGAFEVSDAQAL